MKENICCGSNEDLCGVCGTWTEVQLSSGMLEMQQQQRCSWQHGCLEFLKQPLGCKVCIGTRYKSSNLSVRDGTRLACCYFTLLFHIAEKIKKKRENNEKRKKMSQLFCTNLTMWTCDHILFRSENTDPLFGTSLWCNSPALVPPARQEMCWSSPS